MTPRHYKASRWRCCLVAPKALTSCVIELFHAPSDSHGSGCDHWKFQLTVLADLLCFRSTRTCQSQARQQHHRNHQCFVCHVELCCCPAETGSASDGQVGYKMGYTLQGSAEPT